MSESRITTEKERKLSLEDLGLENLISDSNENNRREQKDDDSLLDPNDSLLIDTNYALNLGYSGILLVGSPGTGKSWYAQQIAVSITGNWSNIRSIQFHPNYQYEDFVFGYVANEEGGFRLVEKVFAQICKEASKNADQKFALVIDEFSRSDVVRVFGEALTYIESDKRGQAFVTASGQELSVPKNLVIIGTMNHWDRGIDDIDIALERRFAQLDLNPDAGVLQKILIDAGSNPEFVDRLILFFEELQKSSLEQTRLGHGYFIRCTDVLSAANVWRFRIKPTLKKACRFDEDLFNQISDSWGSIVLGSK
ncbi:MAG: AAA family ATPase [Cyanobacteria bacterium P01_B01_bin.77]